MLSLKSDFPIFTHHPELVYLDSAATSQKPRDVIDAVTGFYEHHNSNVHRGLYSLANTADEMYEGARIKVAQFINASAPSEIIFTANASEAMNLVALGYAEKFLSEGDIIVTTQMEHHSNFVPWLNLSQRRKLRLHILPITADYRLDYQSLLRSGIPLEKIKLVSLTYASNVLGTINPVTEIISEYKSAGIKAKFVVDAAQSIPHLSLDVKKLDCDFLAFSSHKMLGPSGVGVLWGRKELLSEMEPVFTGSHMISKVSNASAEWAEVPDRFEVGTGRLEGVVGLGAAIDYLNRIGMDRIKKHEDELIAYALAQFHKLEGVKLFGSDTADNRLGVFSFAVDGVHAHDVAAVLNQYQICVRAGHHCAQPLMDTLGVPATARASLYLYNTKEDTDRLVEGIEEVKTKLFAI